MLEEFSNPTLLVEQANQDNFTYKMCKNYINKQIVEWFYKINLIKKTHKYKDNKSIYYSTKNWKQFYKS